MNKSSPLMAAGVAILGVLAGTEVSADPIVEDGEHCIVNLPPDNGANVRDGPGTTYLIPAIRDYGVCGIIVTAPCESEWCPIDDGDVAGWVNRMFLAAVPPELYCVTGIAAGGTLNLREGPGLDATVIGGITQGQCGILFLPYAEEGWQRIRTGEREGWVAREFLAAE